MGGQNHSTPTARGPKTDFPLFWGVGPFKTPEKTILALKTVDPALENIYIWNLHKKIWLNDMGVKTILRRQQGVPKLLSPCLGGG